MSRTRKLLLAILAIALVYLGSGVMLTSMAASPYMNVKFLRVLVNGIVDGDFTVADDLTVSDDLVVTDDATIGGDLDVSGALALTGALTASDISVSSFMNYAPQTPIAVVDDGWLTPTGTFQPIYSAGTIGFSKIYTTGFSDGDILLLYNIVAQTIVITDENNTNLTGDLTLGIGDIVSLVYTNTAWWQTGTSNN